jgi:osmotically-inducible protein OsmY
VHHGHVTLTGTVAWLYQKALAERAMTHIRGVRHVANHINVLPRAGERDVRKRITGALHRTAEVDASRIDVDVADGVARLSGTVRTWTQRQAAAHAAAAAPGIIMVDNQIVVEPDPLRAEVDELC